MTIYSDNPEAEMRRLRAQGVGLPAEPFARRGEVRAMMRQARAGINPEDVRTVGTSLGRRALSGRNFMNREILARAGERNMARIEESHRRRQGSLPGARTDMAVLPPKPRDPFQFFEERTWGWLDSGEGRNLLKEDDEQRYGGFGTALSRVRKWCRLIYLTHPLVPSLVDIYCLAGGTRVVTWDGVKPISELAGTMQRILTTRKKPVDAGRGGGVSQWIDAEFASYGEQRLWEVTIARHGITKTIRATSEHRWFARQTNYNRPQSWNEFTTSELKSGYELRSIYPRNVAGQTNPSPVGVMHGFVYGDGARGVNRDTYVDLHGSKDIALLPYFGMHNISHYHFPHTKEPSVRVWGLPGFFKKLPDRDESASYLYGWLAGYFAADGTVSKAGQPKLFSSVRENLEFVRDICLKLGIRTHPISQGNEMTPTWPNGSVGRVWMWSLSFDRSTLSEPFFVISEHQRRWVTAGGRERRLAMSNWRVVEAHETDQTEEVFCAKVPQSECFALEDDLLTGNSKFPLLDIEFVHKDKKISDFYNELFLDELDYQNHLFRMAKEFWTVGEVFSLASWHDGIGAFDEENLINPDDVIVARNRALASYDFHLRVPESLKKLLETRQPKEEYETLVSLYPYIVSWARENKKIPVSNVLMKHQKFEADAWEVRGVPFLMRALTTLMHEQSLMQAQDAVADRLYAPLIQVKLGLEDVDEEGPWIPEPEEIDAIRDDVAYALMSDFRLIAHHHGLDISSVFGREAVPRMDQDFERVDLKIMQVFGIGQELLTGGKANVPYAAGALNRELLTQMLQTYQIITKQFVEERVEVVAERQGHYDYEKRGDQRFPIPETVLMADEETGEEYVTERNKLALPELHFRAMNLNNEEEYRRFLLALETAGVPISAQTKLTNIPVDFDEERDRVKDEKHRLIIDELEFQKKLFEEIYYKRLPIPTEYQAQYDVWLLGRQGDAATVPATDISDRPTIPHMAPGPEQAFPPGGPPMAPPGPGEPGGDGKPPQRPPESDEQRKGMPRPGRVTMKEASSDEVEQRLRVVYGDMKLASPAHARARVKMKLPDGITIYAKEDQSGKTKEVVDESTVLHTEKGDGPVAAGS